MPIFFVCANHFACAKNEVSCRGIYHLIHIIILVRASAKYVFLKKSHERCIYIYIYIYIVVREYIRAAEILIMNDRFMRVLYLKG